MSTTKLLIHSVLFGPQGTEGTIIRPEISEGKFHERYRMIIVLSETDGNLCYIFISNTQLCVRP